MNEMNDTERRDRWSEAFRGGQMLRVRSFRSRSDREDVLRWSTADAKHGAAVRGEYATNSAGQREHVGWSVIEPTERRVMLPESAFDWPIYVEANLGNRDAAVGMECSGPDILAAGFDYWAGYQAVADAKAMDEALAKALETAVVITESEMRALDGDR